MNQNSQRNDPIQKIRSIYTNGDPSAVNEVTNLLVSVLREGDVASRSALKRFFDVPTMSQEESDGFDIDRSLISRVRLFINGTNANRVTKWLSSYETSLPYSAQRSLLESILRDFVASRTQVEAMKCRLAEAETLRSDARSRCAALKSTIESISNRVAASLEPSRRPMPSCN